MTKPAALHSKQDTPMNKSCDIDRLYKAYREKLLAFILGKVGDQSLAEDILHETMLKMNTCFELGKTCQSPKAYMFQIANFTIADHFREKKKGIPAFTEEKAISSELNEEMANCLQVFLKELPAKYQQAVQMADIEGIPQKKIAEKMGISLSGAKSRVQRGREQLKALFVKACNIRADRYGNVMECEEKNCG